MRSSGETRARRGGGKFFFGKQKGNGSFLRGNQKNWNTAEETFASKKPLFETHRGRGGRNTLKRTNNAIGFQKGRR